MRLAAPEKPRSENYRPELVRLPQLTPSRLAFRRLLRAVFRLATFLGASVELNGIENFPMQGPALMVTNHLGDADGVVGLAKFPRLVDALAKIELYDLPVVGRVLENYGVIWVHRGTADRNALRAAFKGLEEGRIIGIAPEGRQSLIGGLEEGTGGAAFIALRASVPVLPVTFTGTENWRIYGNLKRLRRTPVTMTIGPMFRLDETGDRKNAVARGTESIMRSLAEQLPSEYRGLYQ